MRRGADAKFCCDFKRAPPDLMRRKPFDAENLTLASSLTSVQPVTAELTS